MWTYEEFIADRNGGETPACDSAGPEQDCGTSGEGQPALSEQTPEAGALTRAEAASVNG